MGTRALMEQRCFIQHCVGIYLSYKIAIFSRDKIKTYKLSRKHEVIHMKERVVNNHFYHMVHTKEEGTYHRIEKLMKEMPGFLSPQSRERLASPLNS